MQCREFYNYAGQWMEGERLPEAVAHLESCPVCHGLIADLEAIRSETTLWVTEEIDPPARLWVSLRERLEAEGLIRKEKQTNWLAPFFPTAVRPALAGGYLALLLVAAGLVGIQSEIRSTVVPPEIASLESELRRVESRMVREIGKQDPAVVAPYKKSLAIVDNFIALCEKSVREDPQNDLAREYLYGAYQQKAELLATMLERGVIAE
jgi:hypothetical protein